MTIARVSYPSADYVKKWGRANRIRQPMFYCSCALPAVFSELRAKPGEIVALSEWEIMESLWMHNLGYHPEALQKIAAPPMAMRSPFISPIPNETEHNAEIRRCISLTFTTDVLDGQEHQYKASIAINEILFDRASPIPYRKGGPRYSRVAGTVYPAMKLRGAADNVVIFPDFVDSSLRIRAVYHVLVEAADEEGSSFTLLVVGIARAFLGPNIIWQENLPPEMQRRSRIALENGDWVFRDDSGDVYHRHKTT